MWFIAQYVVGRLLLFGILAVASLPLEPWLGMQWCLTLALLVSAIVGFFGLRDLREQFALDVARRLSRQDFEGKTRRQLIVEALDDDPFDDEK